MDKAISYKWLTLADVTRSSLVDLSLLMKELTGREFNLHYGDIRRFLQRGAHIATAFVSEQGVSGGDVLAGVAVLVEVCTFSGYSGRIEDVVVSGEYRGRGIAQALMTMLVSRAGLLGLHHVELTSRSSREAANRLYHRVGFEQRETNVYRLVLDGSEEAESEPVTLPDIPRLRGFSESVARPSKLSRRHGIDLDDVEEVFNPPEV